jgi:hypothetical protein
MSSSRLLALGSTRGEAVPSQEVYRASATYLSVLRGAHGKLFRSAARQLAE